MSKLRNRNRSSSSVSNRLQTSQSLNKKPIFGVTTTASFYIPQSGKRSRTIDLTDFHKEKVFNKHISFYRENFNQNDSSLLPFMSTLRQRKINVQSQLPSKTYSMDESEIRQKKTTKPRPFSVCFKRTMNQQIPKQIFDSTAKQSRLSTAYYRWHNKSGRSTKNSVEFECSLRDYNSSEMNPEEKSFFNLIKPINYINVEAKQFEECEMICPRQRRLFRVKGS